MTLAHKIVAAISLALVFNVSLLAQAYTIQNKTLKEALEIIASQSKLSYAGDPALLESKKANNIENVEGLEKALEQLLKGTGLEAIVKDSTIIIKAKENVALDAISIIAQHDATTEDTGSYTTKSMNTATKLGLSIRDTPQSVTVLTDQKLEDLGVTSYQEMLNYVTGVSVNRYDERLFPTARGFDVDYYLLDGIPTYAISDVGASDIDLAIYDRVEVVKGANGLMTGAGNPAVGLNFIRKHANSKEVKGDLEVSGGSWDAYSATMDISAPLNEEGNIRGRLIAKHEDKKSYMDGYEKTNDVVYGVVDMDLTETTYLSLAAEYQKLDRNGVRFGGLPAFYSDGTRTNFSRSQTVSEDWTYWNSEMKTYYLDFKQYLYDDIALNVAYSYRKLYSDSSLLFFVGTVDKDTGIGIGDIGEYRDDTYYTEQNIDIYLSVPFELANLNHEIAFGTMQNKTNTKFNNSTWNFESTSLTNPFLNLYTMNIADPQLSLSDAVIPDKTTQTGTYIAGKFSLMDDLKLIAGFRVSDWKYKAEDDSGNRVFNNELTPYGGLIYDLNENHSIYVSYTDIFNPQSYKNINGSYLDPIIGKNYETGVKGEYFDKHLNASLSVFRVEQDNVAERIIGTYTTSGDPAYRAVPGVTSKGIELDINGEITEKWNIGFGIANFEAKDADGNNVKTTSSRTMANLFTKYTIEKFGFGLGLNYRSKTYTGSGAEEITQDSYILTNAMISYDMDKHIKLQLNVNNIFDKEYYEGIGYDSMSYGAPRNATLSFKYTF